MERHFNELQRAGLTIFAIRNLVHDLGNIPYNQIDAALGAVGLTAGTAAYQSAKFLAKNSKRVLNYMSKKDKSFANTPDTAEATPTVKRSTRDPKSLKNAKAMSRLRGANDDDEDMQIAADLVKGSELSTARAASVAGTGGTGMARGNQETPIYKQVPVYGFPNTHTVVLPWTNYYSVITPANLGESNVGLEFRLNCPYDIFPMSINNVPTAGSAISEGRYNTKYGGGTTWPNPLVPFPTSTSAGTNAFSEAPQWREVWDSLYTFYTVLGVHYKITIQNPYRAIGNDIVIAETKESFSVANGGINMPGGRFFKEMEYWPGLKWHVIKSINDGTDDNSYATIEGYYKPGDISRNVQNDEDVKTWTLINNTPLLTERLRLFVGNASFNETQKAGGCNIKVQMKYIVQYKDLKIEVKYPTAAQTPYNIAFPTDILRTV